MSAKVQRMNVQKFDQILKSNARFSFQIIDVREKIEVDTVSIPGNDIIHLPLSNATDWSQDVLTGKILDSEKPALCLCHHGVRSMQVASFLGSFIWMQSISYWKNIMKLPINTIEIFFNGVIFIQSLTPSGFSLSYPVNALSYVVDAASKAEFAEVYNVEGGIHAYATEADATVGTYWEWRHQSVLT